MQAPQPAAAQGSVPTPVMDVRSRQLQGVYGVTYFISPIRTASCAVSGRRGRRQVRRCIRKDTVFRRMAIDGIAQPPFYPPIQGSLAARGGYLAASWRDGMQVI